MSDEDEKMLVYIPPIIISNTELPTFEWSAAIDATSWDGPFSSFWMCTEGGLFHLGHVEGPCRQCSPPKTPEGK